MATTIIRLRAFWLNGGPYVYVFLLCLIFFPASAQAATWEEVWPDAYYFNSDSTFVDLESGLIFVEVAGWEADMGDYRYTFMAIDCTRWESFAVAAFMNDHYRYFENWQTDPRNAAGPLGDTSYMAMTAQRICGMRDSLPKDYPVNRF